jgi:hypothetical protein
MVAAVYPRYCYLSTRLSDATTLTVVIVVVITLGTSHLNGRYRVKDLQKGGCRPTEMLYCRKSLVVN